MPPRPLAVLHLISSDRWTGPAEPVTNLVRGLCARGHRVWLGLIPGRSFEQHARALGVPLLEGLHLARHLNPLRDIADARRLAALVRAERVDLIHCHMNHDHWLAAITRRLAMLPVRLVRTHHRLTGQHHPEWGGRLLWGRWTDAVVILSDRFRREDALIARLPQERVHTVAGAVDADRYHPRNSGAAVRAGLGVPPHAPLIGMVAHFKAGRGWRTAVPALAQVLRRHPDAHCLLAGGRSRLVRWVREHMAAAGVLDRTHILTDQRFDWPQVIASLDFSLWLAPGSEASARAVLEVMATGRPVIAGAVGTVPDVIEDGISGLTVPLGVTPEQLAARIEELLRDPERRRALGAAARHTIEARFTLDRQLDETEALYRSLTGVG